MNALKKITQWIFTRKKITVAVLLALLFIIPRLFFAETMPKLDDLALI